MLKTIILNSLREKIRNKSLYIIGVISLLLITFLMLSGNFTVNNEAVTSFDGLINIAITLVSFFASILAVMMSIQTIPNEFERKTTHLVLVRGIKKYEYILSLTISNIIISLIGLSVIYIGIIIFAAANGKLGMIFRLLLGMGILGINIVLISTITSLFSIKMPLFLNGILSIVLYLLGSFHKLLYVLSQNMGGLFGTIVKRVLFIIPNFYSVQREAGKAIYANSIDFPPILTQLIFIYLSIGVIILLSFRKEV